MQDLQFTGKVALVTGAAQGIGEAIVRALCKQGAVVAAVDLQQDTLNRLATELKEQGLKAFAYSADVRDSESVQAVVDRIERELGPIELLVHAAGVLRMGALTSLSDADWSDVMSVNLNGVFHISRAVLSYMKPRRNGAVVTVSSNAAAIPRMHMGAYATSKAAVTMFTKCLGLELAEYGIRCNIVSPGSTDTPMLRSMWEDESGAQRTIEGSLETYRTGIPLRKLATPEDIAASVLFLLSAQAGHLTMHDLRVDGGATLGV
ncbi:2,3-dihydro-2,3-dihydroxybenzoate dehydrogenase [Paenibacillus sp. HWE-109]|uniref:2,3-dihydro-2,3-dihydroxybenzoate dehydrogenase n=1 Tax=Paenibacillus sp. HWE-109 TaxID=1306526 RepID=UPI001EDCD6A5|nr:2,3-dihydro-2,3-dihydroxybenzoate dehydrogenase [Paenibacillus sp. HWE-109]UKS24697.1 2,3-dihydro-2,3-dihydroxybenzoate dehydrogenase [Paenibacillus sp. HWE-109]